MPSLFHQMQIMSERCKLLLTLLLRPCVDDCLIGSCTCHEKGTEKLGGSWILTGVEHDRNSYFFLCYHAKLLVLQLDFGDLEASCCTTLCTRHLPILCTMLGFSLAGLDGLTGPCFVLTCFGCDWNRTCFVITLCCVLSLGMKS
jgi:hypothetical protein